MELQTGLTPPALENKPVLVQRLKWLFEAFQVISTRRSSGLSINPISLTEIILYGKVINVPDLVFFIDAMSSMDDEFLAINNKIRNRKSNKSKGK